MKALVYEGPRIMNIREVPAPELQHGEVLIRVRLAGICGSELGGYLGHNSLRKPPLIMGHEFAGTVEQVSEEASFSGLKVGDRVTANPLVTCGNCRYCRSGQSQLCASRALLGAHRPGAFAEFVAVPVQNVYRLPDHVTTEEGAFAEPFACAVHVCRLLALTPTDRLLIYGAGPIGLFALQAAQVYGLRDIVIVDLNESRLEIARELGGIAVTDINQLEETSAAGFDAVIDAVGAEATRQRSVASAHPGGKVIFTGLHEAASNLAINDMIRNETWVKGAFAYSQEDFETALQWIGQGRVNLLPWTVTAPLSEGAASFEKLITGPGKIAKILLSL
ncbi:galactitol-1-phosphate 5-dehydrogenase [Paenibacillus baekrokdamisoli]|uniref:Galactitol-1-phosphate 5-dehydrogenase n=1 Tax=Paenibacillus baekrokdamisoli TaxID=1712516 RepID=A0A3G9IW25_9BACL|nr:galactitol-1-phosphate 5-dehydrogenase [Paenibacillus baekrokdamisoli]MBB3067914.1 2-desacetyl-2-hydroxyethyl bacteriochlorophyllide A dehydrogenase [Paenibacillus baekrokdamisoli]BBH23040.1 galactitol-1-phosphate 5-dehydrogenase [Paenibacillus baekrokdamisoli]